MFYLLWQLTRGYRLWPWRSPYLRWRMETYGGLDANDITFTRFWNFVWTERRELVRYLRWAGRMRNRARQKQNPASLRLRN
ncbi:MAG: hypothetical protein KGM92_04970 [Acidobacteriota bacterium]|nr:hypothetical protein [Acidobacteriota bacterium]